MSAVAGRRPPAAQRALLHPLAKPVLWALCLAPLAWLLFAAFTDRLGANPAEALVRGTGDWTLRLLCATLAITPLRQATGWHALARFRRALGLFTFFWGLLHFLATA
jgi:sulfoxide reductase heme-binding subunit YedZ